MFTWVNSGKSSLSMHHPGNGTLWPFSLPISTAGSSLQQTNQSMSITRRKMKIAAATYLYQADCDGEWGEIYIDFVNKTAKIILLADWDLTRSRVYARTAIRYLISTGGRNLPKKRRIIFEPQRPLRRQHNRKFDVPNINKAGC